MPEIKASGSPRPPKHLQKSTAKWFKSVVDEWDLGDHHIRILTLAAEAWDQVQLCRQVIAADGMTFLYRFGQPKERPEVGILHNSRLAFARLVRELDLDFDGGSDTGRPPAIRSNRS